MPRTRVLPVLAALLTLLLGSGQHAQAGDLTPETIMDRIGLTAAQRAEVEQGQIVSSGFEELSDKELALTVVAMIPAPIEKVLEFARAARVLEVNREVLAFRVLVEGEDRRKALAEAVLTGAETAEIAKLLQVKPGSDFNLSLAEMQRFADLRKRFPGKGCERDPACSKAVLSEYLDVLAGRLEAYQEHGLAGIEPYARGGSKTADPAEELEEAGKSLKLLARHFPEVYDAFIEYPKGDQSILKHDFAWIKQNIQDRPTFLLSHMMLYEGEELAFAAERQFFVGQSYNSLQVIFGAFSADDSTLVFYLNRTSTDQVAGFMSGTRHTVGRKFMDKEVRRLVETVLTHFRDAP